MYTYAPVVFALRNFGVLVLMLSTCVASFGQWNTLREVSSNSSLVDLKVMNRDTVFAVGSVFDQGSFVLRSQNGGVNWDSTWFAGHDFTAIEFPAASVGYISSFHNSHVAILKTTDGGNNWLVAKDSILLAQQVSCDIGFFDANFGVLSLSGWSALTTNGGFDWNQITNHPLGGQTDIHVADDVYLGMSGTVITYSLDFCESFAMVALPYSGSHSRMDVREATLMSTGIGSFGLSLGFPNNSFGILTKGSFPFENPSVWYMPSLSRFYDVSMAPNDLTVVHGMVLNNNGMIKFVKSADGGSTWNYLVHDSITYSFSGQLECADDSVCYAIANLPGTIYKTANGGGSMLDPLDQVVLSTKESFSASQLTLHPNPALTYTTLTSAQQPMERLALYDLQGRLLHEAQPAALSCRIPLAGLPAGMYVVSVQVGGEVVRKKVVVE